MNFFLHYAANQTTLREPAEFAEPDRVNDSVFAILDVLATFALTAACQAIRVQCKAERNHTVQTT